jgi:hypothetical protein
VRITFSVSRGSLPCAKTAPSNSGKMMSLHISPSAHANAADLSTGCDADVDRFAMAGWNLPAIRRVTSGPMPVSLVLSSAEPIMHQAKADLASVCTQGMKWPPNRHSIAPRSFPEFLYQVCQERTLLDRTRNTNRQGLYSFSSPESRNPNGNLQGRDDTWRRYWS